MQSVIYGSADYLLSIYPHHHTIVLLGEDTQQYDILNPCRIEVLVPNVSVELTTRVKIQLKKVKY